jgi:hypothetical protein
MRTIEGLQVVDADEPVTVHITKADCERGSKKDPAKCAAALALKRDTACNESRVHLACTYLRFGDRWLRYATPPSLKAEIISFDRGGGFYPGDFRLHPMPKALRLRPPSRMTDGTTSRAASEFNGEKTSGQRARTVTAGGTSRNKKPKAEPRVFHRVKGVRERAR